MRLASAISLSTAGRSSSSISIAPGSRLRMGSSSWLMKTMRVAFERERNRALRTDEEPTLPIW